MTAPGDNAKSSDGETGAQHSTQAQGAQAQGAQAQGAQATEPEDKAQAASAGGWRNTAAAAAFHRYYPGVLAAGTVGLAATWLSQHYGAPVFLFALLLGMAFHFLSQEGRCVDGIALSARSILRIGVALLGVRITAGQIAGLGIVPVLSVIAGVVTTTLLGAWAAKRLGLGRYFGFLSGGAVAICGASAALAISAALPQYERKNLDTILAVASVTTLSTIAMVFYPMLVVALNLSTEQAGVFLGGTIHDVAQVVGAGYMISQETGDISTYVKLLRVAMLIPVVVCISLFLTSKTSSATRTQPILPLFLVTFVVLVAINSLFPLPQQVVSGITNLSSWCLVTAIAALGMKTSIGDLIKVGWTPVALMVGETLWIALLVLGAIQFMR